LRAEERDLMDLGRPVPLGTKPFSPEFENNAFDA